MTMVLLTNPLAWRRRLSIVINVITKRPYQQTSTQETSGSGSEWCVVTQNIIRPHNMHTQRLIYALRKFSNVPCTARGRARVEVRGRYRCKQAQLGSAIYNICHLHATLAQPVHNITQRSDLRTPLYRPRLCYPGVITATRGLWWLTWRCTRLLLLRKEVWCGVSYLPNSATGRETSFLERTCYCSAARTVAAFTEPKNNISKVLLVLLPYRCC